jgi:hypothetical protein
VELDDQSFATPLPFLEATLTEATLTEATLTEATEAAATGQDELTARGHAQTWKAPCGSRIPGKDEYPWGPYAGQTSWSTAAALVVEPEVWPSRGRKIPSSASRRQRSRESVGASGRFEELLRCLRVGVGDLLDLVELVTGPTPSTAVPISSADSEPSLVARSTPGLECRLERAR